MPRNPRRPVRDRPTPCPDTNPATADADGLGAVIGTVGAPASGIEAPELSGAIPCAARTSAWRIVRASGKRCCGSRAIARCTSVLTAAGRSGRSDASRGGSSVTIAAITAVTLGPSNGRRPASAW